MVEKNSYRFFRWCIRKRSSYVVAPELHAQSANCWIGDQVGNARELNVKGTDCEVGIAAWSLNERL